MKKNRIFYFIIIILISTSYMSFILGEKIETEIVVRYIKYCNIFLLLIFTGILFMLKNNFSKFEIKIILILLIITVFLKKFYLSFFVIIITSFIEKKIRIKFLFYVSSFMYSSVLFLNTLGFLEFNNIKYGIRKFEEFEVFRHALGFCHPNTAMSLLLPIFSALYYLYYPKYNKAMIFIILIVGKIIFDLTYSRTTFLLIILFVLLILLKDKYIKRLKNFFLMEVFLINLSIFYLTFYLRNTVLNNLFSGRLWLFYWYLTDYKITLFGCDKIERNYKMYPLDNVYLRTLFENGILGYILLIILIFFTMYILLKNEDYKAVRIFAIILIFGFMEGTALFYYFNIIYFIISDYIFVKKDFNRRNN